MVDIIFHVSSTAVDTTTCLCETPTNLCAQTKLDGAGTNSAAWALLISAACPCLLVTLLIMPLLQATLHIVLNRHEKFLRLFSTLLKPNTVDRTCAGNDTDSFAGTRQGDRTSSSALVQPASALSVAAGGRQKISGKRPGDDGSDAEDNDRSKRTRVVTQEHTLSSYVCPFRAFDPDNPNYLKCGRFSKWNRLREHLLDRTHAPRDRCSTCGEIFTDDVEWGLHTSARACEWSPRALERPFWVDKHQAASIRNLSRRGSKAEPMEEMYRKVCEILFGSESDPDRNARAHPTWFPHFQHTDDQAMGRGRQERWNILKQATANLLGMQDIPGDESMQQVIDYIVSYLGDPMEQTHAVPSHEPGAGDAAAGEQLGNNEVITEDWMPCAAPTEGQVPRIPEPDRYAPGEAVGELEHPVSNLCPYVSEDAGPLVPLDPAQASSLGPKLDKLDYDSEYVNPVLLQRQDAHHLNYSSTSAAFPSGSATSQASESAVPRSSWGQGLEDAGCSSIGERTDSLDDFDFSVEGASPIVGSVQLSDGRAPEQQPEYRDVSGCFE